VVILAGLHFSVCVSYRIESDRIIARNDIQAGRQADAKYNLVRNLFLVSYLPTYREKVRTTNFTTSKTKKNIEKVGDNHYIEKIYKSDQNIQIQKDQNIESDLPMVFCLLNLT
jgi:hypothetical protein